MLGSAPDCERVKGPKGGWERTTEKWRWRIRVVALLWDPVVVECGGGGGGEDAVRFVVIANGWSSGCGWSWRVRNGREDAARST